MSLFHAVTKLLPGGRKKQDEDILMGETLDGVDEDFLLNLEQSQQTQMAGPASIPPASKPQPEPMPKENVPKQAPFTPAPQMPPQQFTVHPMTEEDSWDEDSGSEVQPQKKKGFGALLARLRKKPSASQKPERRKKTKSKKQKIGDKAPTGKVMLQIIVLVVLFFVLGFMAYRVLFPHHEDHLQPQVQTQAGNDSKDVEDAFQLGENDPLFQNPFVEIGQLNSSGTDANGNKVLAMTPPKKISSHNNGSFGGSYQTGALPAIPGSYPRPSLPAIPQAGSIPAPSTPPAAAPQQSQNQQGGGASVQGVLTGEDGNNMAIMSDGTVLSQGESYRDGRIAYIGGDGIHFDNGNTIPYGNQ